MATIDDKIAACQKQIEKLKLVKESLADPEWCQMVAQELAARQVVATQEPAEAAGQVVLDGDTAIERLNSMFKLNHAKPTTVSQMAAAVGVGQSAIRQLMARYNNRFSAKGKMGREKLFVMSVE